MSKPPSREGDLATAQPERLEWVAALTLAIVTLATFAVLAPFARVHLTRLGAFIPAYEAALSLADLITSVLLFAHFNRAKSYAVLLLACAYLYNALIVVPHFLTFPGVFSEAGLLGGGAQTTAWLYCFWHGGFAVFILAFAIVRRTAPEWRAASRRRALIISIAATYALVAALTLVATEGEFYLTPIIAGGDYSMLVSKGISPTICALCGVALVLLWPRLRTGLLDLWIMVVATAWLCDVLLSAVVGSSRFDLGWYLGRSYGLVAAVVLLVLLLIEFSRLDIKLESRTAELRASQAMMQTFFEHSSECYAILARAEGEHFRYAEINEATLALYRKRRSEVIGRTTVEVLGPASAAEVDARLIAVIQSGSPQRYEREQGGQVIEALATPLPAATGHPEQILVSARDITERRRLEDQLRQSQKMEAVGQLTGGIAHDFNNMLAIMMGSLDMARRRIASGSAETSLKWIENASEGAARAATLTSRLLSFSRRQTLDPKLVDVNDLVAATSELLRQTIPESVQIETVLAGGLWKVFIDPTQVENSLVNLAVNARDAMPDGGKITIETRNTELDERYAKSHAEVKPGQYAMIAVTDTGVGMPPEIMERAFEPFFTTKEPGRGTGLGLSQVFGFARQSHGHVKIYSELGRGTTIKLYLPRALQPTTHAETPRPSPEGRPKQGELVLVVEDELAVRKMSVEALRELGFAPLTADNPAHALRLLDTNEKIALLFTDVVMPGMTGRQLADQARLTRPNLKVLYTTGYSRNAIVHNGVLEPGTFILTKPFTIDELDQKIREILAL